MFKVLIARIQKLSFLWRNPPELGKIVYVLAYILKDNQALLIYRTNTTFSPNQYSLIGGKVEQNESARQALIRELFEEIGIVVHEHDTKLAHVINFRGKTRDHLTLTFIIENWLGEPFNKEPEKHGHLSWFTLDALPHTLIPRHRHIIECIQKGDPYLEEGF